MASGLALILQASAECQADAKCVYLDPAQMAELATQAQGNTAFISGFIAFGIMALAGIFWRSTGA